MKECITNPGYVLCVLKYWRMGRVKTKVVVREKDLSKIQKRREITQQQGRINIKR